MKGVKCIMDSEKLVYYKKKLANERKRVLALIHQMEDNETINSNVEMSSELSFYDNHPSDLGSEMNDMERGRAFKEHEMTIVKKIDDAFRSIEDGSYGTCHLCGKEIPEERLDFLPYAQYCVTCQSDLNTRGVKDQANRGQEEDLIDRPFGYGYTDFTENVGFDAEDSYQRVSIFNYEEGMEEHHDPDEAVGFVEPIEKISNAQYKAQLPD